MGGKGKYQDDGDYRNALITGSRQRRALLDFGDCDDPQTAKFLFDQQLKIDLENGYVVHCQNCNTFFLPEQAEVLCRACRPQPPSKFPVGITYEEARKVVPMIHALAGRSQTEFNYPEKECPCGRKFKPHSAAQKLCDECRAKKKIKGVTKPTKKTFPTRMNPVPLSPVEQPDDDAEPLVVAGDDDSPDSAGDVSLPPSPPVGIHTHTHVSPERKSTMTDEEAKRVLAMLISAGKVTQAQVDACLVLLR